MSNETTESREQLVERLKSLVGQEVEGRDSLGCRISGFVYGYRESGGVMFARIGRGRRLISSGRPRDVSQPFDGHPPIAPGSVEFVPGGNTVSCNYAVASTVRPINPSPSVEPPAAAESFAAVAKPVARTLVAESVTHKKLLEETFTLLASLDLSRSDTVTREKQRGLVRRIADVLKPGGK